MPSRKEDQSAGERKKSWLHSFRKSKPKPPQEDGKREQQIQAYISWVNSHLCKKPGSRLVEDLRRDMVDGITLVNLVEILSGQMLADIERVPLTPVSKKENTEKVLKFMTSKKIRMHHTTAKDILEGNIKSIMRLILALAGFYKQRLAAAPSPSQQAKPASPVKSPPLVYANPSAKASPRVVHENPFNQYAKTGARASESFELRPRPSPPVPPRSRGVAPGGGGVRITRAKERFREVDLESSVCSSMGFGPVYRRDSPNRRLSELFNWPSPEVKVVPRDNSPNKFSTRKRRSGEGNSPEKILRARRKESSTSLPVRTEEGKIKNEETNLLDLKNNNDEEEEILRAERRATLIGIEELVSKNADTTGANNSEEEEETTGFGEESDTDSEGMAVLLEQRDFMENQLGATKELLYGLQHLLLSGMVPENAVIPADEIELNDRLTLSIAEKDQLKQKIEMLNSELVETKKRLSVLEKENGDLNRSIKEREAKESDIRTGQLKQTLESKKNDMKANLDEKALEDATSQLKIRDTMINQLQKQLDEATRRLVDLQSRNETIENQMEKRGFHIKELQTKLARMLEQNEDRNDAYSSKRLWPIHKEIETAETEIKKLKVTLAKLKVDPVVHCTSVASLERCLSTLVDKIDSLGSPARGRKPRTQSLGCYSDDSKKPRSPILQTGSGTKVVYFTERTVTPFMTTISKRLGEICLRDFKKAFDRSGSYRYHFKTIDPDYGTVKQEISRDSDVIPGYEGRIVAWVEEDSYV